MRFRGLVVGIGVPIALVRSRSIVGPVVSIHGLLLSDPAGIVEDAVAVGAALGGEGGDPVVRAVVAGSFALAGAVPVLGDSVTRPIGPFGVVGRGLYPPWRG